MLVTMPACSKHSQGQGTPVRNFGGAPAGNASDCLNVGSEEDTCVEFDRHFNDIGVRSFILYGAPWFVCIFFLNFVHSDYLSNDPFRHSRSIRSSRPTAGDDELLSRAGARCALCTAERLAVFCASKGT